MRTSVKTYCRRGALGVLAVCFGITLSKAPGDPVPAATAPTTAASRPAGVTIRGHVSVSSAWAIQKPDLSRVVVYLASSPALDAVAPPSAPVVIAQRNKMF